ncbi:MAG: shikimate kinase [Rhodospirillaceae bacterium]|nr:shikimate kinase [Rhodospirillaceae bacterium]MBL6941026.1 shikimate kinase [Rhodospirillales bacterium]
MADNHPQKNDKHPYKPIVMIGLMGAGKSRIGRELAAKLALPFVDADEEIVKAAGCSVSDIFELYGEDAFRDVESRVISRLLNGKVQIIATGGGAFINADIRKIVAEKGISLWLRAELDILAERTSRRGGRPLLKGGDAKAILKGLMDERYPVYAEADIIVESKDVPINETVKETAAALSAYLDKQTGT